MSHRGGILSRLSGGVVAVILAGQFIPAAPAQGASEQLPPERASSAVKSHCSQAMKQEFSFAAGQGAPTAQPVKTVGTQEPGQPVANPLFTSPERVETVVLQPYVVTAKTLQPKPVETPRGLLNAVKSGRLLSLGKNTDLTAGCEPTCTGNARATLALRYRW